MNEQTHFTLFLIIASIAQGTIGILVANVSAPIFESPPPIISDGLMHHADCTNIAVSSACSVIRYCTYWIVIVNPELWPYL